MRKHLACSKGLERGVLVFAVLVILLGLQNHEIGSRHTAKPARSPQATILILCAQVSLEKSLSKQGAWRVCPIRSSHRSELRKSELGELLWNFLCSFRPAEDLEEAEGQAPTAGLSGLGMQANRCVLLVQTWRKVSGSDSFYAK